jgi:hypothetical protein
VKGCDKKRSGQSGLRPQFFQVSAPFIRA